MARIFISYSRKDKDIAHRLASDLDRLGADVWVDVDDIPAGMKWSTAIQQGLDACEVMIVIISPTSMASVNVEDEWQAYLDDGKPIIPVLWRPARVHFQLRRVQYIDFRNQDYDTAFAQLHSELRRKGFQLARLTGADSSIQIPTQRPLPLKTKGIPRRVYWIRGVLGVLALAIIGGLIILRGGENKGDDRTPPTQTESSMGMRSTNTATVELTDVPQPTPTATGTLTLTTPLTSTATRTLSPTPTLTPPSYSSPQTALEHAQNFTGSNNDWEPFVQTFDEVEMVLVPAGCFMMGSENGADDEKPVHRVCFEEPFWIDQTEVTNAQFAVFSGQANLTSYFSGDNRPREQIVWEEAREFCNSRGARLPTEAEWEYAARGPNGVIFPWGNELAASRVIWNRSDSEGTAAVGTLPEGKSWVGAFDLSGNVWEWVADWYDGAFYERLVDGVTDPTGPISGEYRVLKGGSWNDDFTEGLYAAFRNWFNPSLADFAVGFRCVRSVDSTTPLIVVTPDTPTPSPVMDPLDMAQTPVSHNTNWEPVIQEFDGVEMVLVPAGCFDMGSTQSDDEQPVHQVCFEEPFWIDRTEVTNGQFAAFNGQAASASRWAKGDRPREQITWTEAAAFCESRGARLPTEAEWEYAARGPNGLAYPWGNGWQTDKAVWSGNSNSQTAVVGSLPAGVSWVGALDLSGNVWEWVADWYGPYPEGSQVNPTGPASGQYRVLRGGAWNFNNADNFRASYRVRYLPQNWDDRFGFRCARSR